MRVVVVRCMYDDTTAPLTCEYANKREKPVEGVAFLCLHVANNWNLYSLSCYHGHYNRLSLLQHLILGRLTLPDSPRYRGRVQRFGTSNRAGLKRSYHVVFLYTASRLAHVQPSDLIIPTPPGSLANIARYGVQSTLPGISP